MTPKQRRAAMSPAIAGAVILATSEPAAAETRLFTCPHARILELTVIGPNAISAAPIDGKPMRMTRDPKNSLRYSYGEYSVTVSADHGQALLEIPDWGSANCIFGSRNVKPFLPPAGPQAAGTADGRFPMAGQSLGGIMRSAPSMSAAKVMSLSEGSPITLIERAGTTDGYDWFKISFRGTAGYQWGGIMCAKGPIRGILQQCTP